MICLRCVKDQCYGRGVTLFWAVFFSGSVSLARVTPMFLAVTGFLSSFRELFNTFDTNSKRGG